MKKTLKKLTYTTPETLVIRMALDGLLAGGPSKNTNLTTPDGQTPEHIGEDHGQGDGNSQTGFGDDASDFGAKRNIWTGGWGTTAW